MDRTPTTPEKEHWATRLRSARGQSHSALLTEARALGSSLFNSAEYAARQRSDEEFVTDLYWAYLQRAPDTGGYLYWLNRVRAEGRAVVLTSFGESIEFDANVRGLCETAEVTGERHWALTDHVGSVRVVTNEQGEVVGRRDNLPFGQAVLDVGTTEGGGAQASMSMSAESSSASTGLWTWHNTIRTQFAQMEKDAGTGLDHTPFRKYESGLGRWTSPDPYPGSMSLSDPQSFNRYAYVSNDPVNLVDPSGLDGINEWVDVYGSYDPWLDDPGNLRFLLASLEFRSRPVVGGGDFGGGGSGGGTLTGPQEPSKPSFEPPNYCKRFADIVESIAKNSRSDRGFVRQLQRRFEAAPGTPAYSEFRGRGFRQQFQDEGNSFNQARHFVGGLARAFYGSVAAIVAGRTTLEAYNAAITIANIGEDPNTESGRADRAVNEHSALLGVGLAYSSNARGTVANYIRNFICDPDVP